MGSITKTAIAVIALQLVGEGTLSLDDTIEWLPGMVPNGGSITIRMLLNHTSGIFNYTDDSDFFASVLAGPYRHWRPREVIAVAVSHPPVFPPERAGRTATRATSCSASCCRRRPTNRSPTWSSSEWSPLDLDNTYFANGARFQGSYAHGYAPPSVTGDGYETSLAGVPGWAWAAGALSQPPDLARFYQALLSGRLLSPALLRTMTTTVSRAGLRLRPRHLRAGHTVRDGLGSRRRHPRYVSFRHEHHRGNAQRHRSDADPAGQCDRIRVEEVLVTAVCAMFRQPCRRSPSRRPAPRRCPASLGMVCQVGLRLSDYRTVQPVPPASRAVAGRACARVSISGPAVRVGGEGAAWRPSPRPTQ